MDEDKGFVVKDRRTFKDGVADSEDGPPPEADQESSEGAGEEAAEAESEAGREKAAETWDSDMVLPPVDFSMLVMSLSSSAAVHLGLAADPVSGQTDKNLPLAKQTIDILGMLQEKTKGNLEDEEQHLLDSILFDMRIQYVNARGG